MAFLKDTVMYACNEGGHFSEMMALQDLFEKYHSVIVTDDERASKTIPGLENVVLEFAMGFAQRRKELAKSSKSLTRWSYLTGYLKLFFQCMQLWFKHRPKVIISTGSNMAVALFLLGHLFGSKNVYIENRAQVLSANVTGKICRRWCDKIIVQWPELVEVYGTKAEYHGTMV